MTSLTHWTTVKWIADLAIFTYIPSVGVLLFLGKGLYAVLVGIVVVAILALRFTVIRRWYLKLQEREAEQNLNQQFELTPASKEN